MTRGFQGVLWRKAARDNSVGMATRYGLEGPGNESRWRRDSSHRSMRSTQPRVQRVLGLFPGVQSDRGVDLTTRHPR